MTALDLNRIAALKAEGFALGVGHHDASEGEGCAMDLIAWQTTGEITDMRCRQNSGPRSCGRSNTSMFTPSAASIGRSWSIAA